MAEKSNTKTINLSEPVQFGEEKIQVLEVRKPSAADMRHMPVQGQTMGHFMDLAAQLSGQPSSVIDMLSFDDLNQVMEIIGGFMEPGRRTGSRK